jgi:hypothetical protein
MNLNKNDFGVVEHVTGCTPEEWNRMKYFVNRDDGDTLEFDNGYILRNNYRKGSQFTGDYLVNYAEGGLIQYSKTIGFLRYWASVLLHNGSFTWQDDVIGALKSPIYDDLEFRREQDEYNFERADFERCNGGSDYIIPVFASRHWEYEYEYPEKEGDERGEYLRTGNFDVHLKFDTIYHEGNTFFFSSNDLNHVITRHAPQQLRRQLAIEFQNHVWNTDDKLLFFVRFNKANMPVEYYNNLYMSILTALEAVLIGNENELLFGKQVNEVIGMVHNGYELPFVSKIEKAVNLVDEFYSAVTTPKI